MKISPILIFIVISIVGNIIKSSKKNKGNARRDVLPGMNSLPKALDSVKDIINDVLNPEDDLNKELDINITDIKTNETEVISRLEVEVKKEKSKEKSKVQTTIVERIKEVDVYDQKAKKKGIDLEMTPENVIHGVIMAEILQPPRAKRPYRPLYLDRE